MGTVIAKHRTAVKGGCAGLSPTDASVSCLRPCPPRGAGLGAGPSSQPARGLRLADAALLWEGQARGLLGTGPRTCSSDPHEGSLPAQGLLRAAGLSPTRISPLPTPTPVPSSAHPPPHLHSVSAASAPSRLPSPTIAVRSAAFLKSFHSIRSKAHSLVHRPLGNRDTPGGDALRLPRGSSKRLHSPVPGWRWAAPLLFCAQSI